MTDNSWGLIAALAPTVIGGLLLAWRERKTNAATARATHADALGTVTDAAARVVTLSNDQLDRMEAEAERDRNEIEQLRALVAEQSKRLDEQRADIDQLVQRNDGLAARLDAAHQEIDHLTRIIERRKDTR